ncbi:Short-chain alcohol dehydrogenase-like protein [Desulfosarcina cetonica]|nr:Short-chain alcohol dehydrogenase-like protein [Desulfosarcina cetonica]
MDSKIALVTGGSRGLGKNTILHLAQRGVDAIFTYHSKAEAARQVVAEVERTGRKAVALQLDTGDTKAFADFAKQVKQALEAHWQQDHFDFLVNNAGVGLRAAFSETTEEQFDRLMNINFKGVFFLTQSVLPLIADGGRIVNISSGLARFSLPGHAAYAAAKGAVEVLTRYLAKELGDRRICVNAVAPGAIETDFGGGVVRDNRDVNTFIASQTALGRVGLPDDIGAMVALLLCEGNRWINGQRIEASGGIFL